uniref:SGNH domain-containing protein n=1 Tax=Bursaphelenchus xylophilus TaxID=6326 RepID=A0A1I7RQB7_BURXY
MVSIGDDSYSAYLVHWSLIKLTEYTRISTRLHKMGFTECLLLLLASLQIGALMEKAMAKISTWITCWQRLLSLLGIFAISISLTYFYIYDQLPGRHEGMSRRVLSYQNPSYLKRIHSIYENRTQPLNMTSSELIRFHREMSYYIDKYVPKCKERYVQRFGKSNITQRFEYVCMEEGEGTKEVVLIGNSLARDLFFGMKDQWRHLYRRLTLIAHPRDIPFQHLDGRNEEILDILRSWERPIQILIVQHSYKKDRITPEYIANAMQQEMQQFYDQLDGIVEETVLFGYPENFAEMNSQTLFMVFENHLPYNSLDFRRKSTIAKDVD